MDITNLAGVQELERLRHRLRASTAGSAPPGQMPAAVLVALLPGPSGWYLLLTRRTDGLGNHRGEIAFPGGRQDAGETSLAAALREANEELGIDPADVEVLGPLPVVETRVSRFAVFPWVGILDPGRRGTLAPSPYEVAEVIEVPLEDLQAPAARRDQRFIRGRHILLSPAYDLATAAGGVTIWGATARIVSELLEVIR
jgi:8-oxo-dGTP pyrophosphatase MutT (NUDIX family)